MLSNVHLQKLVQRWKGDTPFSYLDIPPYTPGDQLYEFQNEQEEAINNETPTVEESPPPAHVATFTTEREDTMPAHHTSAIKNFSLSISMDSISAFTVQPSLESSRIDEEPSVTIDDKSTTKKEEEEDHIDIDEPPILPPPLVTDDDDNEAMLPATKQDKDKAVQVRQDMQEEHSFHFEDDDMDYDYDKMIDQDMNDIEVQPVSIEKEMQLDVMEKGIRPDDDIEKAMQPDDVEKAIQPEPEESPMTAMEKQSSVEVETIDESPPELDTDEATEAAEEKVQEQLEVDFHFEDDGMDYGYDEEIQQESTGSTPEETQRLETTVEKPSFEIEEQIKQDPTSEALRTVKYAMRNQRSRIKSKKNLANAHIVAIRKVSLDVMKEMKQNTTDAFEKSLIEDYYNSINDSLKSRLKKYNNYIDVNTGLKRIKSYYQQTETEMFQLVQKEVAISNEIEIQRNKLESIKSNENSFATIESLFDSINKLK